MGNYIDILKEAKEKGILLDSCGNIEREKDTGLYTDLCGASVEEMTPKGGGGSGSGSTVTISNLLPSGNRVATINVDGVNYTLRSPYQEQTDWNEANSGSTNYIKNKPDISIFESKSNKVTTLDSGATDEQYPSAKSTYDALLQKINGSGVTDVIVMTKAEYAALEEKDEQKFYVVKEEDATFGGLTISPAPLYYGPNGFEIKDDDWNHNSYRTKYGTNDGSYYFSIEQLGKYFDSKGSSYMGQASIDNKGNRISYKGKNDWRLPTSAEFSSLVSNRDGGTVNGNTGKHYSRCDITDVKFNNKNVTGALFFPDKEINGATLNGYDNNVRTELTNEELNVYLNQGCIFIPNFEFYGTGSWTDGAVGGIWSATYTSLIQFVALRLLLPNGSAYGVKVESFDHPGTYLMTFLVSDTVKTTVKLYKGSILIADSGVDPSDYYTKNQSSIIFEQKSNKVSTIDSGSTNTQYPSARAVYYALQQNKQVQSDWTEEDSGKTSYIKNKPNLPETVVEGDGILKIKSLLQSEYDALETKEPFTLYVVQPDPLPFEEQYLTFEVTEVPTGDTAPYLTFGVCGDDSVGIPILDIDIQYRKNGGNWEDFLVLGSDEALFKQNGDVAIAGQDYPDQSQALVNSCYYIPVEVGDIIEIRGTNLSGTCVDANHWVYKFGVNRGTSDSYVSSIQYMPKFKIYGNVLSLIYGDDFVNHTDAVNMCYLFDNIQYSIESIDNIVIPDNVTNNTTYDGYSPLYKIFGDYNDAYKSVKIPATKGIYDIKTMLGGTYEDYIDPSEVNLGDAFYEDEPTITLPSVYGETLGGIEEERIVIENNDYAYPIYIELAHENDNSEPNRGLLQTKDLRLTRGVGSGSGSGSGSGQMATLKIVPDPDWATVYIDGAKTSTAVDYVGTTLDWKVEADGYTTATGTYTLTNEYHTEYVTLVQDCECDCDGSGSGSGSGGGCDCDCDCDCDGGGSGSGSGSGDLPILTIHLRKDTVKLIEKIIAFQYAFYSVYYGLEDVSNPITIPLSILSDGTRFHDGILLRDNIGNSWWQDDDDWYVDDSGTIREEVFDKLTVWLNEEDFETDNKQFKLIFGDDYFTIDFASGKMHP